MGERSQIPDAYSPAEMARRASDAGVGKATMGFWNVFALSVLAGAFIGLGAHFATVATADNSLPYSLSQILGGLVFCLGLILVVVAGAELFTGNTLIVMAWVSGRIPFRAIVRNWMIVYAGNFVGSVATVGLIFASGVCSSDEGAVAQRAVAIAAHKAQIAFVPALFRGIMCNALVCLAVWLCFGCRSTVDKIAAIIFPITAFVAMGFEHSVANMYFIPMGMLITAASPAVIYPDGASLSVTWAGLVSNLVPVTLGNIVGGSLMVGLVYWFVYVRAVAPPSDSGDQAYGNRAAGSEVSH